LIGTITHKETIGEPWMALLIDVGLIGVRNRT
jgi:hypothetical protein